MEVRVLLFGPAAAAAGSREVAVHIAEPTVGSVLKAMGNEHPTLRPFVAAGRLAVNHAFAPTELQVQAGDEVALIAMVSGG